MKLPEDILFEDKQIIVCRKRAGISTQTARLGEQDMVSLLKNYLKTPYLGVIHRLDQPVEGVLVFAKTKAAAARLSGQNQSRGMGKYYYAAVLLPKGKGGTDGRQETAMAEQGKIDGALQEKERMPSAESLIGGMEQKQYVLTNYLKKDGRSNLSYVTDQKEEGSKLAILRYQIEKILPLFSAHSPIRISSEIPADSTMFFKKQEDRGSLLPFEQQKSLDAALSAYRYALLKIELETGRHHQIRVQRAAAGMPLLGESKYGSETSKKNSKEMGIREVALCCCRIVFTHPVSGREMCFSIEPSGKAFLPFFQ